MLVYRYESQSGRGPYHASWGDVWDYLDTEFQNFIFSMGNAHSNMEHPPWHKDFRVCDAENMVSGFTCEDKALDWFDGWLDDLDFYGFKLYSFIPEEVEYSFSGKQIRFVKSVMPRAQVF